MLWLYGFDGSRSLARSLPPYIPRSQNAAAFGNLDYLSLYGNSLTTVDGIGVLKHAPLLRLNLGDNLLTDLPEDFREVCVCVLPGNARDRILAHRCALFR